MSSDKTQELGLWAPQSRRTVDAILADIHALIKLHRKGILGGARMPEDANPGYETGSREAAFYFTLPMALNYQRNSYKMWEAALKTAGDSETAPCFRPEWTRNTTVESLRSHLCRYKLALQPVKHVQTWYTVATSFAELFGSDVRKLFSESEYRVECVLEAVQIKHKRRFPYLSGNKICHYWLYVMEQYCGVKWRDRHLLSVAPDTHVIQASIHLGIIDEADADAPDAQRVVAQGWRSILEGTSLVPIDVHTPLWLWNRMGCPSIRLLETRTQTATSANQTSPI